MKSIVFIVVALALFSIHQAQAEVCNGSLAKMRQFCSKFVLIEGPQIDPSPECCQVYKSADMKCCCENVSPSTWGKHSLEKVVYVAKFCGNPIAPGSTCGGNYITVHN